VSVEEGEGTHCLLEATLVAPVGVGGLLDFLFGGGGIDDAILAGDLVPVALLVLLLFLQIRLDLFLEVVVEALDLALLHAEESVMGPLAVRLEQSHLVADAGVLELRRRHQVLELRVGARVVTGERALVQARDGPHVGRQRLDLVAHLRYPLQVFLLSHRRGPLRSLLPVLLELVLLLEITPYTCQLGRFLSLSAAGGSCAAFEPRSSPLGWGSVPVRHTRHHDGRSPIRPMGPGCRDCSDTGCKTWRLDWQPEALSKRIDGLLCGCPLNRRGCYPGSREEKQLSADDVGLGKMANA